MKDCTPFPIFKHSSHIFSHVHQHSFSSRYCAVLLGVFGEVSTHHPELVFQWTEVLFIGRSTMVVLEHIPPYLASGQPLSNRGSAVPLLDSILMGDYLLWGIDIHLDEKSWVKGSAFHFRFSLEKGTSSTTAISAFSIHFQLLSCSSYCNSDIFVL